MRKALLHLNHTLIKSLIHDKSIVLDMTLGHGNDSFSIAPYVKHIYAFDIQESALLSAQSKLSEFTNITYIHDSFTQFATYVDTFDLAIFNLGYLPKGDKSITTLKEDTLLAIQVIIQKYTHATIVIMSYLGHDEGLQEFHTLESYFHTLESHHVIKSSLIHDALAPVMFWIYKK